MKVILGYVTYAPARVNETGEKYINIKKKLQCFMNGKCAFYLFISLFALVILIFCE